MSKRFTGYTHISAWIFFILIWFILNAAETVGQDLTVVGYEIEMIGELNEFQVDWKKEQIHSDLEILTITLSSSTPSTPPVFSLKWSLPSYNIAGFWSVTAGYRKIVQASWAPSSVSSMLARSAPVFALFGHDNQNRLNVAISDALNTVKMSCGLMEEDSRIYCEVKFFSEEHGKLKEYEVEIRFDKRPIPYYKALQEVPEWWASFPGYEPARVPVVAKMPMYSTWYSYHQNVTTDALRDEAELARRMGYKAIIVDDGWQTLDSNRGYAYTGDWQPERMQDMKAFVESIHDLDMKVLLWYAVPFMGERAKHYERFKGKYLRYWNGQGAYVLDPRYPEVREYIIDIYKKAIQEWNLDGFKLDFIAMFTADRKTVLEIADGRDYASVNEAADKLMTDVMAELKKVKPDIMIEFRQPYVGPLMRKYGNIFRVGDCPNVSVSNRIGMVDLRLMSGNTAVHSDMIMWHSGESVEHAALQFLNILFAVPQVSVRLGEIPKDHFKMIKFLTEYWIENRSVLLDGTFEALYPLANYPVIIGHVEEKQIVAVYNDHIVTIDAKMPLQKLDIINAQTRERVVLDVHQDLGTYNVTTWDCKGNILQEKEMLLNKGGHSLSVPASGIISFSRWHDTK